MIFAKKQTAIIERALKHKLLKLTNKYPIVTLAESRQSGKCYAYKRCYVTMMQKM